MTDKPPCEEDMTELTDEAVKALLDGATPGPWLWEKEEYDEGRCWHLAPGVLILDADGGGPDGADEIDAANARLIAAAPDLARALLDARAELDTTQTQVGDWIVRADEANVKVETLEAELARIRAEKAEQEPFQERVRPWMLVCFGEEVSNDRLERGDRLLEEVLELLQSGEYPKERVVALLDYVWSRPKGEPVQEVGGVMVTLAAYCLAHGIDMHDAAETELARIWTKVEKIRAKHAAKPKGSALPQAWPQNAELAAAKQREADDWDALIVEARAEAGRAMRKFPQPNYVISKIAEEAGEVVKAAIHCAEGRETAENLRGEMKQVIAMLYRLWVEGDQVHGLPPARAALAQTPTDPGDGWTWHERLGWIGPDGNPQDKGS